MLNCLFNPVIHGSTFNGVERTAHRPTPGRALPTGRAGRSLGRGGGDEGMARTTDTIRGARLAYDLAFERTFQRELFAVEPSPVFWEEIKVLAGELLAEAEWSRRVMREEGLHG